MTDVIQPRHFAKRPTPKYYPRLVTERDDERPLNGASIQSFADDRRLVPALPQYQGKEREIG